MPFTLLMQQSTSALHACCRRSKSLEMKEGQTPPEKERLLSAQAKTFPGPLHISVIRDGSALMAMRHIPRAWVRRDLLAGDSKACA